MRQLHPGEQRWCVHFRIDIESACLEFFDTEDAARTRARALEARAPGDGIAYEEIFVFKVLWKQQEGA